MDYYGNNDFRDYLALQHHGVLGMKWGVRRYQPYSVVPRGSGKGGKELGDAKKYKKLKGAKPQSARQYQKTLNRVDRARAQNRAEYIENTAKADRARTKARNLRDEGKTKSAARAENKANMFSERAKAYSREERALKNVNTRLANEAVKKNLNVQVKDTRRYTRVGQDAATHIITGYIGDAVVVGNRIYTYNTMYKGKNQQPYTNFRGEKTTMTETPWAVKGTRYKVRYK